MKKTFLTLAALTMIVQANNYDDKMCSYHLAKALSYAEKGNYAAGAGDSDLFGLYYKISGEHLIDVKQYCNLDAKTLKKVNKHIKRAQEIARKYAKH